ncbi:MAG: Xaa-Pro peptidase family protein [Candidatus Omnitrophota bacterium]
MDYQKRIEQLSSSLTALNIDGIFVTNETNVAYLSGFRGSDSMILLSRRKKIFITDSRYVEEAASSLKEFEIELVRKTTFQTVAGLARRLRLKTIGYEPMNLPSGALSVLRKTAVGSDFVPVMNAVERLRQIKDNNEIRRIKIAVGLTKKAIRASLRRSNGPGMTEKLMSDLIEIDFLKAGGRAAFGPIVAVNSNSSKPHAVPGKRLLNPCTVLMIDIGAQVDRYNSDLTRTFLLGRIPRTISRIYSIVEEAQRAAIRAIRPGVPASEIDLTARRRIYKNGFGKHFGHSLGHGVGLDVHEAPTVGKNNQHPLREGMVFTVEPAVYVPRLCGVRIEDMVVVTKKGCEVLSQ